MMHRVTRTKVPKSLQDHAKEWTDELEYQLALHGCKYEAVPKVFKNRYRKEDVKQSLRDMYGGLCCFCEGVVYTVSYDTIEHYRPKARFPLLSFKWENLNYACTICNSRFKGSQWIDEPDHILDPSTDDISQFLSFNLNTGEYDAIDNNLRAKNTIALTGLNRDELVEIRKKMIVQHSRLIKKLAQANVQSALYYIQGVAEDNFSPYPTLRLALLQAVLFNSGDGGTA